MIVPFHKPLIEEADIASVVQTLQSGWLTTGPAVQEFERRVRELTGARHAIAVNSCTAAMHLALAGLGIGPGDEVITTPYTFVATAEAIQYTGARPVFVDIRESDFNIDPARVQELIDRKRTDGSHGRLKALMPVHIAGHLCEMPGLMQIAAQNGLKVVEDAAHCLEGTMTHRGDRLSVGKIGHATCFSFYATKNITTGEGGILCTDDDELADRVRMLSLHGMSRDAWKRYTAEGSWYYEIVAQGFKYNMPDILAALGAAQIQRVQAMHSVRTKYAGMLLEELAGVEEIQLPRCSPDVVHAWHLFLVRLKPGKLTLNRNQFVERLKAKGVHTSVHFIPLHLHPFYQSKFDLKRGEFPISERVYESVISLPLYPAMTEEEVLYVARAVREVVTENRVREAVISVW